MQEYKKCQNILTLHDAIFELIKDCIKKESKTKGFCFDEMEDDVLSKLFAEPENSGR